MTIAFNSYTKLAANLSQTIGFMVERYEQKISDAPTSAVQRESWGYNFNAMLAEIAREWGDYLRNELAGSHAPQSLEAIACELLHNLTNAVSEMLTHPRDEYRAKVTVLSAFAEVIAGRDHRCDFTALATREARYELERTARNPDAARFIAVRDELVRLGADAARIDGDYAVLIEEAEQRRKDEVKRIKARARRAEKRAEKEEAK